MGIAVKSVAVDQQHLHTRSARRQAIERRRVADKKDSLWRDCGNFGGAPEKHRVGFGYPFVARTEDCAKTLRQQPSDIRGKPPPPVRSDTERPRESGEHCRILKRLPVTSPEAAINLLAQFGIRLDSQAASDVSI